MKVFALLGLASLMAIVHRFTTGELSVVLALLMCVLYVVGLVSIILELRNRVMTLLVIPHLLVTILSIVPPVYFLIPSLVNILTYFLLFVVSTIFLAWLHKRLLLLPSLLYAIVGTCAIFQMPNLVTQSLFVLSSFIAWLLTSDM